MSPSSTSSTRWTPTPEQLMILEEMYKSGVRTPSASQIQKITAHLSFYGKIEGKNVFYWFQNHKARDRQKLRRKLSKQLQQQQLLQDHHHQLLLNQYQQSPQNSNTFNVLNNLIDPSPSASYQYPSPDLRPAEYFHQQLGETIGVNAKMTNYMTLKMDHYHAPTNTQELENCMIKSHDDDWMMMMSMTREDGPAPILPCCSNRPLKTLQLFPITSPSLKQNQIHQGTTSQLNMISFSSTSVD